MVIENFFDKAWADISAEFLGETSYITDEIKSGTVEPVKVSWKQDFSVNPYDKLQSMSFQKFYFLQFNKELSEQKKASDVFVLK